ncbi:MAG: FAD-binding oxidoreductase [Deltaproteobacteria bacterium]|nr:FAD-binding oxidoreductase [Deltaproteobacteria bacterium]
MKQGRKVWTEPSQQNTADVVICGAGIAGISAAYHLSVKYGIEKVLLVDEGAPLSLTSDKSTECYRNFWPGPGDAMVGLMNRSIDILEHLAHESNNYFHLSRRGYVYATADPNRVSLFKRAAEESARLGAGPLRYHDGQPGGPAYIPSHGSAFEDQPDGIDLILDQRMIQHYFPYLSKKIVAVIHARRCGWFSVQQLGMYLLERAKERGVRFSQGRVEGVEVVGNKVRAVSIRSNDSENNISTPNFINAAGPFLKEVGHMVGVELPVFSELHLKMSFNDRLGIVPRHAPMLIWTDTICLPWSEEERKMFAESDETKRLLEGLPSGVHTRPEGGPQGETLLGLWAYDVGPVQPVFPFSMDLRYSEMVLRGLTTMIPGMQAYLDRLPKPVVDGGYYTKTRENRPLIGRLPIEGAYLIGALSGFGVMAGCGAGELLADHITGSTLPHYAPAFFLERYEDVAYQKLLETWGESGQL